MVSFLAAPVDKKNCKELFDAGYEESGIYTIKIGATTSIEVFCDHSILRGGWTVIQRRVSDKTDFEKDFSDYTNGFGDFYRSFWLGLQKIHQILQAAPAGSTFQLYIGMESFDSFLAYARYDSFSITSENDKYKLSVSGHHGSIADAMAVHDNQQFSAKNQDNDNTPGSSPHCAQNYHSGWWHKDCSDTEISANLNGIYLEDVQASGTDKVVFRTFRGGNKGLRTVVMAIKPN